MIGSCAKRAAGSQPAQVVLQSRRKQPSSPPPRTPNPAKPISQPTECTTNYHHPDITKAPVGARGNYRGPNVRPAPPPRPSRGTTDDLPEQEDSSGEPSLYCSPVLAALADEDRPEPSPACETCPVSMWFTTARELKCYCGQHEPDRLGIGSRQSTPRTSVRRFGKRR